MAWIIRAGGTILNNTQGWINRGLYRLYDGKDLFNTDVILVIIAKYDWNGAYSNPSPVHIYRTITNKGPALVFKRVSTAEEINAFTFEQKMHGNRICGLWIKAHGCPKGIHIGKGYCHEPTYHTYVNIDYIQTDAALLIPTLNQLEPQSAIVIESCKAGLRNRGECLAERISKLRANIRVFAPLTSCMAFGNNIKVKNGTLKATFIDFRVSDKGDVKGFFLNAGCFVVMCITLGFIGRNQTIVYRS